MKRTLSILVFFILSLVTILSLLNLRIVSNSSEDSRIISTTIFPIYDIARTIAGDKFQVELLLPPGVSPHAYEPSPQAIKLLNQSELVFTIGVIDDWATRGVSKQRLIRLDSKVNLLPNATNPNPHYWLSTTNAAIIANQIALKLSEIDPENEQYYANNLADYQAELKNLHDEIELQLQGLKYKNIATMHDSMTYFAAEFGLNIVGTYEEFPGQNPSPQYLANFIKMLDNYQVRAVFSEPQIATSSLKNLALDQRVNFGVLDPLGGSPGRNSYIEMMRYNAHELERTLSH